MKILVRGSGACRRSSRRQRHPVEADWRLRADRVTEGREQIETADKRLFFDRAGPGHSRPPHDQWRQGAPQVAVGLREGERHTVVGEEDDQRLPGVAVSLQRVEDCGDHIVASPGRTQILRVLLTDPGQAGEETGDVHLVRCPGPGRRGVLAPLSRAPLLGLGSAGVEGPVRVVCVSHQEPRFGGVACVLEEAVGCRAVGLRAAAETEFSHGDEEVPAEALDGLQVLGLAEDASQVAGLVQQVGKDPDPVMDGLKALGAVAVRPHAGHDRGAAGLADGDGDMAAAERYSLPGEAVECGSRPDDPASVAWGLSVHVVGGDQEDVCHRLACLVVRSTGWKCRKCWRWGLPRGSKPVNICTGSINYSGLCCW